MAMSYRLSGNPIRSGAIFLMLVDPSTGMRLAFQQVEGLQRATWPLRDVPQQLHLDLSVSDAVSQRRSAIGRCRSGQHFSTIALMTLTNCCTCSQIQRAIRFASSW